MTEQTPRILLCRQDKRPIAAGWRENSATAESVERHIAVGGLVGIVPASLGCLVVDIDDARGDMEAATARIVKLMATDPASTLAVPTRKGCHVWVRLGDTDAAREVGNSQWRMSDPVVRGDIRGSNGFVIAWGGLRGILDWARTAPQEPEALYRLDGLLANRRHKGTRNDTLNRSVFAGANVVNERARATADGMEGGEIEATIASALRARDKKNKAEEATRDAIFAELWLNLRTGDIMHGATKLNDRTRAVLALQAKVEAGIGLGDFDTHMNASCIDRERDPFREWLENLPPWDGTARISGILADRFGADDTPLNRWASQYLFACAVDRTYKPGCAASHIPVLIGPQGCGKSSFLRHIVARGEWASDSLRGRMGVRQALEAIGGAVICEIPEMLGVVESDKAWLTGVGATLRRPYQRSAEHIPFRHVIVGTTNEQEAIPNDITGMRRWIPVVLKADWPEVMRECEAMRAQWWAEALALPLGSSAMPAALYPVQAKASARSRQADHGLEGTLAALDPDMMMDTPQERGGHDWYTAQQIARVIHADATIRDPHFVRRVGVALSRSPKWRSSDAPMYFSGRMVTGWRKA